MTSNSLKTIRNYYIEGFIDDNRNKIGTKLNNKYVYSFKEASELIQEKNITDILIAIPSIGIKERRNVFDKLKELRVNIKILPGIQDLISGAIAYNDFKNIELDDLIERNSSLDEKYINSELTDKTILITGAGGSIGSEITIQIAKSIPKELILIDHSEYNLYEINKKINNFAINQGKKIKIRRELVSITIKKRLIKFLSKRTLILSFTLQLTSMFT